MWPCLACALRSSRMVSIPRSHRTHPHSAPYSHGGSGRQTRCTHKFIKAVARAGQVIPPPAPSAAQGRGRCHRGSAMSDPSPSPGPSFFASSPPLCFLPTRTRARARTHALPALPLSALLSSSRPSLPTPFPHLRSRSRALALTRSHTAVAVQHRDGGAGGPRRRRRARHPPAGLTAQCVRARALRGRTRIKESMPGRRPGPGKGPLPPPPLRARRTPCRPAGRPGSPTGGPETDTRPGHGVAQACQSMAWWRQCRAAGAAAAAAVDWRARSPPPRRPGCRAVGPVVVSGRRPGTSGARAAVWACKAR